MTVVKNLEKFERKKDVVFVNLCDAKYVVKTSQRIRADLVWVTESVRSSIDDALQVFARHKEQMLANRICVGDRSYLR